MMNEKHKEMTWLLMCACEYVFILCTRHSLYLRGCAIVSVLLKMLLAFSNVVLWMNLSLWWYFQHCLCIFFFIHNIALASVWSMAQREHDCHTAGLECTESNTFTLFFLSLKMNFTHSLHIILLHTDIHTLLFTSTFMCTYNDTDVHMNTQKNIKSSWAQTHSFNNLLS